VHRRRNYDPHRRKNAQNREEIKKKKSYLKNFVVVSIGENSSSC
jgi:hypothetical protein